MLEIQPDIYGESPSFQNLGSVEIHFTCREATNEIILNSVSITITDGSLELEAISSPGGAPDILSWILVPTSDFFIISLDDNLIVGEDYIFRVSFTGQLVSAPERYGLYWSSYLKEGQIK